MGGSQKSKRVTWASDVNLCQVRLFLSEESPSQVGMGTQDHLQAKTGGMGMGSDDNLPPGFEEIHPANPWTARLSQVPLVKWKCPPRFKVNADWQVVAGEESREIEAQSEREMGMLEAIYPRPSAIPPNPSVSADVENESYNDQLTPAVPITPIEDEDAVMDPDIPQPQHLLPGALSSQGSASFHHQADGISVAGLEPDIAAAAQAALSSILSTGDQGSLIDRDLLIKILSNPTMIEQLLANRAASSSMQNVPPSSSLHTPPSSSFQVMPSIGAQTVASPTTHHIPSSGLQVMPIVGMRNATPSSAPGMLNAPSTSTPPYGPNIVINRREPVSAHMTRPELGAPPRPTPGGPFYPPTHMATIPHHRPSTPEAISAPSPSMAAPMTKDISYYKSLIQQHGGERREAMMQQFPHQGSQPMPMTSQEVSTAMKPRELKQKISKPCIYFNTPRGCRNGANCMYQHDPAASQPRSSSMPEVQTAKRVKLDKEITGN